MRLIDADALTKELAEDMKYDCSYYHDWTQKETRDAKYSFAIDRIASAPTIDAVHVKHGWWVVYTDEDEYAFSEYFKCSICGATHYTDDNYCPNCGAKMDGEADA